MLIYSLEEIQRIAINVDLFAVDINVFLNYYTQIEKNDKYEPIFSLTDKYKSFPINSNKSTKNFFQNNKWKIDESNSNKINQDLKLSLNKLSSCNYESIKNTIISILTKNITKDILNVFMRELFEKIWFDEKFLELYVNLCYDLCNNNQIKCDFTFIIEYCRKEFNNRIDYKNQYLNTENEELMFINKRKIIGTIEFISHLYIKEYLDNDSLQEIINELFIDSMSDLDYESFYKLWIIINDNNRLEESIIMKYKDIIKSNLSSMTNNRIKILLKTLVEQMNFNDDNNSVNLINKYIMDFKKDRNLSEIVKKLKTLDINLVINELIMNELENKEYLFIDVILLLTNREQLLNIIDLVDLDELEIDIPNVRITYEDLKSKLKL